MVLGILDGGGCLDGCSGGPGERRKLVGGQVQDDPAID
jgi:hypothetical protein